MFAGYLICCLESCSPHIRRLLLILTQSIRQGPNLHVKSEHSRNRRVFAKIVRGSAFFSIRAEEPAASRMLELYREVGGDVPEYFSSRTLFAKI